MSYDTTFEDFEALRSNKNQVIPVTRTLFADGETPVALYRKLAKDIPGSFLLESAEQGGIWSRYSFIGISSYGVLTHDGTIARWMDYGLSEHEAFGSEIPSQSLEALEQLYLRWKTPRIENVPPLTGALVGFLGWEVIREIEHLPDPPQLEVPVPQVSMSFAREVIAIDHKYGTVTLISNVLAHHGESSVLFEQAQQRLNDVQKQLSEPGEVGLAFANMEISPQPKHRTTKEQFAQSIATSRQHILDGDVFQVVISQRFDYPTSAEPIDVYRVLRSLNPSPYMYLLNCEDSNQRRFSVIGSSPEALVKISHSRVITHPIAGSRPRGQSPEHDLLLEHELLDDKKERAEHLMLVDLARNDLLRVCESGSVEVTEFMRIERYSHIMHIVSSVEGNLSRDKTPIDVFRSTFPAGTLSGAPKPRALEIIDSLEPAQRGVYGGVVGYFDFAGDADLAIAIRTVTLAHEVAYIQAGAGIVMDSDPESEYRETLSKAAAPLRAVAIASQMIKIDPSS